MDKRGYQLKLEKEVKKLNTPEVSSGVPVSLQINKSKKYCMVIRLHKWKLLNDGSNLESKYSSIHIVVYAVCRHMALFTFVLCHIQWENLVPMLCLAKVDGYKLIL